MFQMRIPDCLASSLKSRSLAAQPLSGLTALAAAAGCPGTLGDARIEQGICVESIQEPTVMAAALAVCADQSEVCMFVHPDYADIGFERRLVDALSRTIFEKQTTFAVQAYSAIGDDGFAKLFHAANVMATPTGPHSFLARMDPEYREAFAH